MLSFRTTRRQLRLDGARELRQAAAGSEANTPASDKERFTINISFGKTHSIHKTVDLKPIAPERDEEDKPTKLIEPKRDDEEQDDEYEREYEPDF